jgi:protein O-mannosyl-transferase
LNWGGALYAKGQYEEAIQLYRQGVNVNPLNASLHYSLSIALEHQNNTEEAKNEMALALKIDPNVAKH